MCASDQTFFFSVVNRRSSALSVLLSILLISCQPKDPEHSAASDPNPPADGFRSDASDPQAIAWADSVMLAMGGRRAWDQTRYLGWNFFGSRYLIWDKTDERVRIRSFRDSTLYLVDLKTGAGEVYRSGERLEDPALRDSLLKRGQSIWINDSYWLFMPYKLKDSGVALTYLGRDTMPGGDSAVLISLDFEGVGDTPQNKYHVYIHPETRRVGAWSFFRRATDSLPAFTLPWKDYRSYEGILLSGKRGERKLSDIQVWEDLPDSVFTSPKPWNGY